MGRPKDFQVLFQDLVAKYKSKSAAEKEYKTYMVLAKEQKLDKNAKLSDISMTDIKLEPPPIKRHSGVVLLQHNEKKQRLVDKPKPSTAGGVSSSEKELYERLVEAERHRAEAEKQGGDDLSKIAMMLAGGKGGAQVGPAEDVIPPSPAAAAGVLDDNPEHSKTPSNDNDKEDNEEHTQQGTQNTMTTEQKRKQKNDKKGGLVTKSKSKGLF